MNKPNTLFAAILLSVIFAAVFTLNTLPENELLILNADTGDELLRLSIVDGDEFALTTMHSVQRSPYTDYYKITEGNLYLTGARFYSYGAGVDAAASNRTTELCDDGSIYQDCGEIEIPQLVCYISPLSDLVLSVGGVKYSLGLICGTDIAVEFKIA